MDNADPITLFERWYQQAREAGIDKPHAMALSTTGLDGRPSSRIVLLSSFDARGFVFHTNYKSHKGKELAHTPWAALLFWWDPLGCQVRIEGPVEKIAPEESDAYFRGRPREGQLSAYASDQSCAIASREVLEAKMAALSEQYKGQEIPRPSHWGGYRVIPQAIEFWQSRAHRLHERVHYWRGDDGNWQSEILAP